MTRTILGGFFVGHGMQKLAGWFGGHGPEGTGQFFESVGLRPGREQALAAGTAEAGGGALLGLGLATPAAVAALTAVMTSAIRHVHWSNGPWNGDGGWELNASILAGLAALAECGPGPLSLDAALGIERRGTKVALAALGAGVVGSAAASALASRPAPEPAEEPIRAREPVGAAR